MKTVPMPPAGTLGSPRQWASVDQYRADNGPESGSRVIRISTPAGLDVHLHPDRALDIGRASVRGVPIAWLSQTGFSPGAAVDPVSDAWLRTFGGGLLATCGLDTIGEASTSANGQAWGLHGRVGAQPASITSVRQDTDAIRVEGTVRQAAVHGERFVLERTLTFPLDRAEIHVHDVVRNEGCAPQPHMILYHFNIGWPFVACGSRLTSTTASAPEPRNEAARDATTPWDVFGEPDPRAESLVYRHHPSVPGVGARLESPTAGMALDLMTEGGTLPWLHQWKVTQPGQYVLGLEPSNCETLKGRAAAESEAAVPIIEPGAKVEYTLRLRVTEMNS